MQDNLSINLIKELTIGSVAGFTVAPFITIVDKAITQNASGAIKLFPSMINSFKTLIYQPNVFFRRPEFFWLWSVYSSTYATANSVEQFCKFNQIPHEIPKLIITFGVNVTMSVLKDRALVKLFGTKAPENVPKICLKIWALRDFCTVTCAFIVPPRLSDYLATKGYDKKKAETTITFWCPILLQIFTAPLHLIGLDIYNNPNSNRQQRIEFLKKEYLRTAQGRMMRMLPAFGIGGVANLKMRQYFFEKPKNQH